MRLFIAGIDGYPGLKGSVPFIRDAAYNAHFEAKKGRLSLENSVFFDERLC